MLPISIIDKLVLQYPVLANLLRPIEYLTAIMTALSQFTIRDQNVLSS